MYETLCTREEMMKSEDMGDFYRIPADHRDLNYSQYFSEGNKIFQKLRTIILITQLFFDVNGVKKLLNKLPEIKNAF